MWFSPWRRILRGRSGDAKPSGLRAGTKFVEEDTGVEYTYDPVMQNWKKRVEPYSAIVCKDGSTVWAEDASGKTIASGESGVDDASVIQSAIDVVLTNGGGEVKLSNDKFYITDTILIKERIRLVGTSSHGAYAPNVAVGARGSSTRLISKTDNPVIRIYNPDKAAEGIDLVNFAILPDTYGTRGDAIYLDTSGTYHVRQIIFDGLEIREMGGYGINKASTGDAYDIVIKNCGFTKNRLGNVKLVGGNDSVNILYCWGYSWTDTWNYEVHQAQIIGGVVGGIAHGIKICYGSIIAVDGEATGESGRIGILQKGTLNTYIIGGRWINWGTCIKLGETKSDNVSAVIDTYTSGAVDGAEVVKYGGGGLSKVVIHDIGVGDFSDLSDQPQQTIDLRRTNDRPFRQGYIEYLSSHFGLGRTGAMMYEYWTGTLLIDNERAFIPLGFQPESFARLYDDFIGGNINNIWATSGTVAVQDGAYRGGVVRLTTGTTSGDSATISNGGVRTISIESGGYDHTSGGFACRFKLVQTNAMTVLIGLRVDANNYIALLADPSVSSNFIIRHMIDGVPTDYDTGVALDTDWHTFHFLFFGAYADTYFDGTLIANNKSIPTGWCEPYISITTNEAAAKSLDVDYIDLWRSK